MKGERIIWQEDFLLIFIEEYEVLVEIIRFNEGFSLLFVECFRVKGIEIMEKICLDILE